MTFQNLPCEILGIIVSFLAKDPISIRYLSHSSKLLYDFLAPNRFSKIRLKAAKSRHLNTLLSNKPLFSKNFYNHAREIELVVTFESQFDYILQINNATSLEVWLCEETYISFGEFFAPYANQFVMAFPSITKLTLSSLRLCKKTEMDLAMMLRNLPQIEFLGLCFHEYHIDAADARYENFSHSISTLKALHTQEEWELERIEVHKILDSLQHLPKLSNLKISGFVISSPQSSISLSTLISLDRLRHFELSDTYPSSDTIKALRRCQTIKTFIFRPGFEVPAISLESLFSHGSRLPDFRPEQIQIRAKVALQSFSITMITFECLRSISLYLGLLADDLPSTLIRHILRGLKNSPLLSSLEIKISADNITDLDNLLKSSTSLKILKLNLSSRPESKNKEIYHILTTSSLSLTTLYFEWAEMNNHIDEICDKFSANSTLSSVTFRPDTFLFKLMGRCLENPNSRITRISHAFSMSDHKLAELKKIAARKWKLFVNYPFYFEEGYVQSFQELYGCWDDGIDSVLYVHLQDGGEKWPGVTSLKTRYKNLEFGKICGKWAIWHKDFRVFSE